MKTRIGLRKEIVKEIDTEIKLWEDKALLVQAKLDELKQLKENPIVFEIAEKYQIPIEKVIRIKQELEQTKISPVRVKFKAEESDKRIVEGLIGKKEERKYQIGLTEAVINLFKVNPYKWFTAKEAADILPNFNRESILTRLSELCRLDNFLERRPRCQTEGRTSVYEYIIRKKPRLVDKSRKERIIAFLKSKAMFWHTSRSIADETGDTVSYISNMLNEKLVKEGKVIREPVGHTIFKTGMISKYPSYKYKWK